jgi:N-acyl-L-homoserine lactone synthetase
MEALIMKNENIYYYSIAKGELREKAIDLHHKRYQELGFYTRNQIDPYEQLSEYFIAHSSQNNEVVGVSRLIHTKMNDLPTIQNFNIYDLEKIRLQQLDKSCYAEISAFTKMQNHDVGMGLIKLIFQHSFYQGLTHLVCCVDERVYNYLHRMFKFPFKVIGEAKVYLGSNTIPCVLDLSDGLATVKERRPQLYEYLLDYETITAEVSL